MTNAIVVVELKRFGWSQKIVKKSFLIAGKPPYAETLKLSEVRGKVLPNEKARGRRDTKKVWLLPTTSARANSS